MRNKTVIKTSLFPAAKRDVFLKLKELKTLQYIATPYASFTPENENNNLVWKENTEFAFQLRLFGLIPMGTHVIRVISFEEEKGIYTQEHNRHVPVWNHRIILEQIEQDMTRYTDEVEIGAGWKTPFVYLWSKAFYAHRQRKWRKVLRKGRKTA